jgi:hypothetical protein
MASADIRSTAIDTGMTASRGQPRPAAGECGGESGDGSRRAAARAEARYAARSRPIFISFPLHIPR